MPLQEEILVGRVADEYPFIQKFAGSAAQPDALQKRQAFWDSTFDHSSNTKREGLFY